MSALAPALAGTGHIDRQADGKKREYFDEDSLEDLIGENGNAGGESGKMRE